MTVGGTIYDLSMCVSGPAADVLEDRLVAAGLLHASVARQVAKPPAQRSVRQTLRTDSDEDSDFD